MFLTKDILTYILNDKNLLCRLCLKTTEGKIMKMQDKVLLDSNPEKTIFDVMQMILLDKMAMEIKNTDYVCETCMKIAIQSYTFIKMCENRNETLHNCLDNLLNSLTNFTDELYISKALFLNIYETNTCRITLDTKQIDTAKPISAGDRIVEKYASKELGNSLKNKTNIFVCNVCNKSFKKRQHIKMHYYRIHAPKNYKCSDCPRSFGSDFLLHHHTSNYHTNFICSECGKCFKTYVTFKRHEFSHKSKLSCSKCGRQFKHKESFRKHVKLGICHILKRRSKTDMAIEELFTCQLCQKSYVQKASLQIHMKFEHGNGKAHVCEWCGKRFTAQSRLKSHVVKHTKEKKFSCEICGNNFVTRESLLYHTRIHTGEKPYSCQFCDEKFLSASRRMIHVRWNHLDPNFQCGVCEKKFKTLTCLKRHSNKHKYIEQGI